MIIETTIQAPIRSLGRPQVYKWDLMEVGSSSLFTPAINEPLHNLRCKLNASIRNYIKDSGKQFTSRKEGEGIRVWRVK